MERGNGEGKVAWARPISISPLPSPLQRLPSRLPYFERKSNCQWSNSCRIVVPEKASTISLQTNHKSSSALSLSNESRPANCVFQSLKEIRELKIPRFRVREQVGLPVPVPVLGYTGNQSNLRYDLRKNARAISVVFRMPSEHCLKLAEKSFSIRFNCLCFFLQYTDKYVFDSKMEEASFTSIKKF